MKIILRPPELAGDLRSRGLVLLGRELLDGQQRIQNGRLADDPRALP
jgi:hypothetical protein